MSFFEALTEPFRPEGALPSDEDEKTTNLQGRQLETLEAIDIANELFGEHGYDDISDFMTGIAATETQLGKLSSDVSYSPFQIDPIRYDDIVFRTQDDPSTVDVIEGGAALKRANLANELLRSMGYGEDFNILGLSENMDGPSTGLIDEARNPLIGALLTRMALANLPESAGDFTTPDTKQQAEYWKSYWNSHAKNAKGKPEHYINEKNYFDSLLKMNAHDNTPLED